jgi:hypothetical protein
MNIYPSRKPHNGESGQAIILIVFSIIGLFGISAVAIDGGNAYLERRKIQQAADSAALSAATMRIRGGDWREAALAAAASNGYNNDGVTNIIELNTPPIDGPYADNPEYIQVIVTSYLDTFFGPVIGVPQLVISTQAISKTKPAEYGEMFDGYALVSLARESKCELKRSFWIHDEATLAIEGGGLFVNSDNPECALIEEGSGSIRILDNSPISIVGGASIQKPKLLTPFPPQTGAIPMNYPPSFQMPKVGCGSKIAEVIEGPNEEEPDNSMTSGNWDGDFPPEEVVNLENGIYCISGNMHVENGTRLHGTNVVFVVDGSVRFGNDAEIQISAPQSGDFKGLLLYMPLDNQNRIVLNGNSESSFRGTILAPSADLHITGNQSNEGFHSQIIAYYIEVAGLDIIHINYKDEQNYDAFRMPEVQLTQ